MKENKIETKSIVFNSDTYMKGGSWLKLLGHSDSLYVWATRTITNHTSIRKYHLKFFPKENFNCLYETYPIELRHHILHKCRRYNNYWNLDRVSLSYFVAFLEYNPRAFPL